MKFLKINSIEKRDYKGKIYDLEIVNSHTYNIDSIIVGNCSGGLHGVGTKCVNALSDIFKVTVKRDGKVYHQEFSKGDPLTEVDVIGTCDINDTGTTIEYHPDKEIFKITLEPNCKDIQNRIDELASLNAGIKVNYKNEITNVEKTYHHEDGIVGYTKRLVENVTPLFENPFYLKGNYEIPNSDGKIVIVEISFIYDDEEKASETIKTFANNINTYEGGFHLQGFRNEYRKQMNDIANLNKWSNSNIELKYLLDGIHCVVSVKVPECEFEGQTKTKLGNAEVQDAVEFIIKEKFKDIVKDKSLMVNIENIINRAVKVKTAEEAARKARANARKINKTSNLALPGKLADCGNKNGYTELFIVEGDSASGCHTADTKIKLADGRDLEISKIVEEFEQGKKNYVFSCDKDGRIFIQPITDAFKTKTNTQVIQLTLDNGEKIKCTPEHPYMLRDGSYKEAQYLTKEDSLMPLYTNYSNHPYFPNFDSNDKRYEFIKMNNDGKWYQTHLISSRQYHGKRPENTHTHHKDFNSLNNYPENLEYMDSIEHMSLHAANKSNSEEFRKKISVAVKKCWQNEEFRKLKSEQSRKQMLYGKGLLQAHREKMKNNPDYFERNWKKLHGEKQSEKRKQSLRKYFSENPKAKEHLSNKAKEQWSNEELRKWRAEKTREQMNDPENRKKKRETMMRNRINKGLSIINSMINEDIEINKNNYMNIRKEKYAYKFIAKWDLLIEQIGNEEEIINRAKTYNHKVVNIEWLEEKEDVYDITVPPYSNFALSAGIFVHNSAKSGRYREFQAILPLRGKILNTEKADFEKMMKSESIQNIIAAIGTGIGAKFDIKKARYDKIILMSDADVDGAHITILILTLIYKYMRPLLENEMIYITMPPLYKVVKNKKTVYLRDDYELKEYKKKNGEDIDVQRFKGLTRCLALIPFTA